MDSALHRAKVRRNNSSMQSVRGRNEISKSIRFTDHPNNYSIDPLIPQIQIGSHVLGKKCRWLQ